ncbi:right-handed parallel beta-helix repeat-containing protein [Flavitalea flava]
MKFIRIILTSILFLSVIFYARGSNYYFSSASGDDSRTPQQAQQQATPWKTLAKLNAFFSSLKAGDTVYLQAGGVFTGILRITQSGAAGRPIVLAAYGTGAAPSINGFTTLTNWVSVGGNIWQSPCTGCGVGVNMVTVSDSSQPMGRYPNSDAPNGGYARVQQHTDLTSITDVNLGKGPNWAGADLVLRKNRYVIERDLILSHSGNTIKYQSTSTNAATDKFGYFIQNNVKTLDKNGEWYYDPATRKMNMYWSTSPAAISIKASMVDTLVNITRRSYISFRGILFQGSNKAGVYLFQAGNINFTNCSIRFSGLDGVNSIQSNDLTFQGVTIEYSNNNGLDLNGARNLVQDSRILRTGSFPGMGNATQSYLGITLRGDNNTIQYNKIDTTGYSPIEFVGASNAIRYNLIDYFAFVKDDGGGIYTWSGDIDSATRRTTGWITGNIVLNGVTCPAGTDSAHAGIAIGIYLDVNTGVANISGNTVANCTQGLYIQDSHELTIQGNTLFNNTGQIGLRHAIAAGAFRNNNFTGNIAVSLKDSQYIIQASSVAPITGPPLLTSFAYMHDNKFARISGNSPFFLLAAQGLNVTGTFGLWKSAYNMDWNSKELPVNFQPYTINKLIGSNLYTKGDIITQFLKALPGSRVIVNAPIGRVDSGMAYVSHFRLHTPDATRTLLVYLQKYGLPYTHFTPVMSIGSAAPYTDNTVVFNKTTGSDPVSAIVFQMNVTDPRIYIDNIDLYLANVTANDPKTNYLFQYNATKTPMVIALSGIYQDAGGTAYQGSLTLQPFTSVVLFKK